MHAKRKRGELVSEGGKRRWRTSSDNRVSLGPLRERVVAGLSGQYTARGHIGDAHRQALLNRAVVWTGTPSQQMVALSWWRMSLSWEVANVFIETLAIQSGDDKVSPETYDVALRLCTAAEDVSVQAISFASQAEVGVQLPSPGEVTFPDLPINEQMCAGVWAAFEAVYAQVTADKVHILAQLPRRFTPLAQQLNQVLTPSLALYEHCQSQWLVAFDPQVRLGIVRRAEPEIRKLFLIGQGVWAPMLLGPEYQQCLNAKLTLDDMELGFDPWILTDKAFRAAHSEDPKVLQELATFWQANPCPGEAFALQEEIGQARRAGLIRLVDGRHLNYCPWASTWVVWRRTITLGSVQLSPGDLFVLYSGLGRGEVFVNEIRRTGVFRLEFS